MRVAPPVLYEMAAPGELVDNQLEQLRFKIDDDIMQRVLVLVGDGMCMANFSSFSSFFRTANSFIHPIPTSVSHQDLADSARVAGRDVSAMPYHSRERKSLAAPRESLSCTL